MSARVFLKARLYFVLAGALFIFQECARADVVYFKDGRHWEGLVKGEDEQLVYLDLGFDVAELKKHKISRIQKSDGPSTQTLAVELKRKKLARDRALALRDAAPRKVSFVNEEGHLFADALLNGGVQARLLLDTGSSLVVLSRDMAVKLGLKRQESSPLVLKVADGRKLKAALVMLDSVKIQGVEARNVQAAILSDEVDDPNFKDGLLGMSFLKKFNFTVDYTNRRLTLARA